MINLHRELAVPASLNTQEVKDYIQECLLYKNDPENNPKPVTSQSYRNSDILEAFDRCFYGKCYLTEEKFFNSWKMDVDHFIPQNENPALIYEWTNLYPTEHKANMSKPRRTPAAGYLDPCNDDDDVESQIIYTLTGFGGKPNFDPGNPDNQKEVNTANLLNRLHNGHDKPSVQSTADLRHGIQKRYIEILERICEWRVLAVNTQLEVQKRNELKLLLSRNSSFTMLCRSMPAVIQLNEEFPDTFFD